MSSPLIPFDWQQVDQALANLMPLEVSLEIRRAHSRRRAVNLLPEHRDENGVTKPSERVEMQLLRWDEWSRNFCGLLHSNDDGRLQAGRRSNETPGTSSFGGPDHARGNGFSRMNLTNVVECCGNYGQDVSKPLIFWRPRRDLNPCYRRERE